MEPTNELVYQLKVILKGSKPAVWRRLQVSGSTNFQSLHRILQTAMGWSNSHLYRFEIDGIQYGDVVFEEDFYGPHFEDARKVQLKKTIPYEKAHFSYEYDFGDSWEHEIIIEKILPAKSGIQYPLILCGKQDCPPEDCGGLRGYAEIQKTICNPIVEEYGRMMEACKTARILK
jgi:hypothetical protein